MTTCSKSSLIKMRLPWAMMISRVARVNFSHPYLENDSSSSLVSHRLRISPWLWLDRIHSSCHGLWLVRWTRSVGQDRDGIKRELRCPCR